MSQEEIIKILEKGESLTINQLAKRIGKNRSTINENVLKLLKIGLVKRELENLNNKNHNRQYVYSIDESE